MALINFSHAALRPIVNAAHSLAARRAARVEVAHGRRRRADARTADNQSHTQGKDITMQATIDRRSLISAAALAAAGLGLAGRVALAAEPSASADASADAAPVAAGEPIELRRAYGAAHGDKCFSQAVVALADGVVVAASIDDYQFMSKDTSTCVPNSDADFGTGVADAAQGLGSKTDNHEAYSAHMAEKGGATQDWLTSIQAIEEFVKGKTADELAEAAAQAVDTVSGCTLADVWGYVGLVADAAADETLATQGTYDGDASTLVMGRANTAPHGTKSFCNVVTLSQGDVLCGASIDEFQFMDPTADGVVAVPNSDASFGEAYAEGVALVSKSQSNAAYSAHMSEKAGATQDWLTSMQAIEAAVAGVDPMSTPGMGVDTISGSTLASTTGYVASCGIAAVKGA